MKAKTRKKLQKQINQNNNFLFPGGTVFEFSLKPDPPGWFSWLFDRSSTLEKKCRNKKNVPLNALKLVSSIHF